MVNEETKSLGELVKEIRRLQAVNQELLQALELAKQFISSTITKATGETE
jgi:hypothetical protein